MIKLATTSGVSVFMNTNGTLLLEKVEEILDSGLTIICVALDGAMSHPTHLYNENHDFDSVIRGIEQFRESKERGKYVYPYVHGIFMVTEDTVAEVDFLADWASRLGIERIKFKRKMNSMPGQIARKKITSPKEFSKITTHPSIRSEEHLCFAASDCSHPWESLFLDCRGRLGICSWDPHRLIDMGEVTGELNSIWNGEQIRTLRRWHSGQDVSVGEPCLTCNRIPGYLVHGAASG